MTERTANPARSAPAVGAAKSGQLVKSLTLARPEHQHARLPRWCRQAALHRRFVASLPHRATRSAACILRVF
jgi:hypothetical protein